MFWKKKRTENRLYLKFLDHQIDIDVLKSDIKRLDKDITALEMFVNIKMQKSKMKNLKDEETQDINNTVLLPDNGIAKRY